MDRVRIDKWLWAARFFKTRGLAAKAVSRGKVHVNAERVKPAKLLDTGDRLRIVRGDIVVDVVVAGLSERRGPASRAALLYEETRESLSRRAEAAESRRLEKASAPRFEGRPDKRARRQLRRITGKD